MTGFGRLTSVLAGGTMAVLAGSFACGAQSTTPPDFQSGETAWLHPPGGEFPAVPGSPSPLHQDPAHPYHGNNSGEQPTFRVADLSNSNLKQWAKDIMKKDNDEVLAGKIAFTERSSCLPAGVPQFDLFGGLPIFFVQAPTEVLIIYQGNQEIRHIHLRVPHSENPKPSWYGESVGHYEGGTLVVDTVGLNAKTHVDSYRTPHTEQMHVVERWHLIDGGKTLQADITVDDPGTFDKPWSTFQRYQRGKRVLEEDACAENNQHIDYHMPVADKPDF
jgi:hypothetical protein